MGASEKELPRRIRFLESERDTLLKVLVFIYSINDVYVYSKTDEGYIHDNPSVSLLKFNSPIRYKKSLKRINEEHALEYQAKKRVLDESRDSANYYFNLQELDKSYKKGLELATMDLTKRQQVPISAIKTYIFETGFYKEDDKNGEAGVLNTSLKPDFDNMKRRIESSIEAFNVSRQKESELVHGKTV